MYQWDNLTIPNMLFIKKKSFFKSHFIVCLGINYDKINPFRNNNLYKNWVL